MDKQEFRLKTETMLQLLKDKSYKEALEIAESIDWKKVKNVSVLCAVSEVYEHNGEFQKSREILFSAYDRSPESKKIIYRLGILALKLGEVKEAIDCYEEFKALAPKDPNGYIFKYKILKCKKAPLEEQIAVLEEFKKVEYIEKWAFELALLYKEAGMISECLEECDDLIIWFSEGKYIYKAMELKMQYKPLTPMQQEKYMNRFGVKIQKEEPVAEEPVAEEPAVEEPVVEEPAVEEPAVEEPAVEEPVVEEPVVEEPVVEEPVVEEPVVEEPVVEEPVVEEPVVEEPKPSLSIDEMVSEWEETQKENAQMIQEKIQSVELEKEQEEPVVEEILSDDLRKLMEELEAESAEIEALKSAQAEEKNAALGETKPFLQKVVAQLAALDLKKEPVEELVEEPVVEEPVVEEPVVDETTVFEAKVFEQKIVQAAEDTEALKDQEEGIKLGDTQSMAFAAKALANAAKVVVPQVEVPRTPIVTPPTMSAPRVSPSNNTGFIVQGRYDLEAQSEIGLKAGLTEEQKKLFSYFVPVHGMSEQLVKVLQDDKECKDRYGTSRIGNIIVVGRRGSGKTVLAVDIVKAIQKARKMKQGKMAIVKAASLNKKDVGEIVKKLHGGALVIENASRLGRHAIEDLCDIMEGQTGELLVVLEDERKPLDRMLNEYPNFKKKFTSRVELPVFINDELVTFAQTYAKENGYKIDDMGILALYSDIDVLQREEKVVTVSDVKELIDDAIENANRLTFKKLAKRLVGRNKDESSRIILTEEDFK